MGTESNTEGSLRELQLREKEIVRKVAAICKRHDLRLFMMGGTFLGAVRHKGFIPWDDDADIGLPREDYDRFLELAPSELGDFRLRWFGTDETMPYYPAQVEDPSFTFLDTSAEKEKTRCAWVDIFPLDGMPNGVIPRFFHKYRLLYLRLILKYSQFSEIVAVHLQGRPLHERMLIALGKHLHLEQRLDTQKCMWKIDRALKKYPYENAKFVVNFMGAYKFREMFPKSIYTETALYPFEDLCLPAPRDYDAVLSQMYGDYMTPPAEADRNKHGTVTQEEK